MSRIEPSNAGLSDRAVKVADLVSYGTGAIVSRTLVKRDSGTVTIFAFDAGQGLSEHTTPHDALVHIVAGEAEVTIGGTCHRLKAGEMIMMPAHVPHALGAPEKFIMVLTMLKT